jgi:hypothetical protein
MREQPASIATLSTFPRPPASNAMTVTPLVTGKVVVKKATSYVLNINEYICLGCEPAL